MKAFLNRRFMVLVLTSIVLAASSGCTPKTPQQKYLADLIEHDHEIARFKLSTGREGDTVFLNMDDAAKEARAMEAIRAFMWVAYEYRNEPAFITFELRFRGAPRVYYGYADVIELATAFRKNDRMLLVLQESLNRARVSGRSPAAAVVTPKKYDPTKAPSENLMGMMQDLQTFLRAWYMEPLGRTGL